MYILKGFFKKAVGSADPTANTQLCRWTRWKVPQTQTALLHGNCVEKPKNFRCDGRHSGFRLNLVEAIWLLLLAAAKFVILSKKG
jgi:hypothetical protein